jgi:hypothetical protein
MGISEISPLGQLCLASCLQYEKKKNTALSVNARYEILWAVLMGTKSDWLNYCKGQCALKLEIITVSKQEQEFTKIVTVPHI